MGLDWMVHLIISLHRAPKAPNMSISIIILSSFPKRFSEPFLFVHMHSIVFARNREDDDN